MRLVKNYDALRNIVQFSHLRRLVAVNRLKKLNIGSDYDWKIPILRRKGQFLRRVSILYTVIIKIAVVFQYRVFPENIAEYLRILLYYARIWNDIYYCHWIQ